MSKAQGPVALIILDGFACREERSGNAVAQAKNRFSTGFGTSIRTPS